MKKIYRIIFAGLLILSSLVFSSCGQIMSSLIPESFSELEKYYAVEIKSDWPDSKDYICFVTRTVNGYSSYAVEYPEDTGRFLKFKSTYHGDWRLYKNNKVVDSANFEDNYTFDAKKHGEGEYELTVDIYNTRTTFAIYVYVKEESC